MRSRVRNSAVNSNAGRKTADFAVAIENLRREVPNIEWISVVYAWFGTSIDAASCSIRPAAETGVYQDQAPGTRPQAWSVMGIGRPRYDLDGTVLPMPAWPLVSSFTKEDGSLGTPVVFQINSTCPQ